MNFNQVNGCALECAFRPAGCRIPQAMAKPHRYDRHFGKQKLHPFLRKDAVEFLTLAGIFPCERLVN